VPSALKIGSVFAVVAAGLLGLGLSGRDSAPAPQPETVALRGQIEELKAANASLQADFAKFREQADRLDSTLGRMRGERTQLEQDYRSALVQQRAAEEALQRAETRLDDQDAELKRLRRELFMLRSEPGATPVKAEVTPLAPAPERAGNPEPVPVPEVASSVLGSGSGNSAIRNPQSEIDVIAPRQALVLKRSGDGAVLALAYGRRDGAVERQRLVLSLDGRDVASVVLTAVRPDFSVAMILPGSMPALLHEGGKPDIRVEE